MPITVEEGTAFAHKFVENFAKGFKDNNHKEFVGDMVASEVSWDWSDGTKGSGNPDEVFATLQKTWGFMVSSFLPAGLSVVVDTDNSVIVAQCEIVINIDGGLPEANLVKNPLCFHWKVVDGKCTVWNGYWNNSDPAMLAALGAVSAKLEAAKAA